MLYIIGIGLNDQNDITVKGLEAVRKCSHIYLESYTSFLQCDLSDLEDIYRKKIIKADRDLVEKSAEETILKHAKNSDTAFLVIGDPFSATTHLDLTQRAHELGIKVQIINNASVITAVGITGLQLYKFGKTTSIPFFDVDNPYHTLTQNLSLGLHTLCLLDLDPVEDKFLSVNDAIAKMLKLEEKHKKGSFTEDTFCIGCARLGGDNIIQFGKAKDLAAFDFGKPPHCLIIPGKMHFMEEEVLKKNYLHSA